jgi:transposase
MPQRQLPIYPPNLTHITQDVGFEKVEGRIYYFHASLPLYSHDEDDIESFRYITSQLIVSGHVKQIQISRTFGVPYISVKRGVSCLRTEGLKGFISKRQGGTPHVITPEMKNKIQLLLNKGKNPSQIAKKLGLHADTIRKAIKSGRIENNKDKETENLLSDEMPNETNPKALVPVSKSERNVMDSQSFLGIGCTRDMERILAALGKLNGATPIFHKNIDVQCGGVLLALPALLSCGLLNNSSKYFSLPQGYYGMHSIFIILAFLALLRIKSIEKVRYCDPGELGKSVGLDRIPEARTLRNKIDYLSNNGNPEGWSRELAKKWLEDIPDLAGTLYLDGHVRVYNGKQTQLPKRYVSREKLCLRGVTDYWLNDALGQPFFVVTEEVSTGLITVLRDQILPRLMEDIPYQPSKEELGIDKCKYRFGIVFDREGYSPAFFKEMWENRIACYTYKKNVKDEWPESEFMLMNVTFPNGEASEMKIAERGVYYTKEKFWMREFRKLTDSGHQTTLVATDYYNKCDTISAKMFSRWSQENFFKYAMQNFGIDRLIEYKTEKMDETKKLVNPVYRKIQSEINSLNGKLSRRKAKYGALIIDGEIKENKIKDFVQKKSILQEEIGNFETKLEILRLKRKETKQHIPYSDLPKSDQFKSLKKSGKQFVDTIKMLSYRAETAMVNILREEMYKTDEARALIQQVFTTAIDIEPNEVENILTIKLHNMANPKHNKYIKKLCEVLNESETIFPGTNLRLIYSLVSNQIRTGQEF